MCVAVSPLGASVEDTDVPSVGESAGKWLAAHGVHAAGAVTIAFDAIAGMAREPNKGKETVRIKILWGGFFEQ